VLFLVSVGHLWRFNGVQAEGSVQAHKGAVYSIFTTNEGLATGGKDGIVRIWNANLQVNPQNSVSPRVGLMTVDTDPHLSVFCL
jgi:WD40 repeat protein